MIPEPLNHQIWILEHINIQLSPHPSSRGLESELVLLSVTELMTIQPPGYDFTNKLCIKSLTCCITIIYSHSVLLQLYYNNTISLCSICLTWCITIIHFHTVLFSSLAVLQKYPSTLYYMSHNLYYNNTLSLCSIQLTSCIMIIHSRSVLHASQAVLQ